MVFEHFSEKKISLEGDRIKYKETDLVSW